MLRHALRTTGALLAAAVPSTALAAPLIINTGVSTTVPGIIAGIINLLLAWSGLVTMALFLYGCILMVGSGGSEQPLGNGKKIMKASLTGLVIILASWMLMSTVVWFISA